MSAIVERPMTRRAPSTVGARISRAVSNGLLVTKRNMYTLMRVPAVFIFELVQPVMFVLLFRFIYQNQLAHLPVPYVQFLMPGIFVQTLAFNGAVTGIGMADDIAKGIVDRFRSMPISPVAMFVGRAISDLVRATLMLIMMIVVGVLTGFRFHNSVGHVGAGIVLILLFSFAFSWIGIFIGLSVKSVEAAQSGGFIWLFPLTFASAAFVPVDRMPGWLQAFAKYNPITLIVDALRGWFDRGVQQTLHLHVAANAFQSLLWIAGVLAVFVPLCVIRFRRM
jgi:ABC-2 type transport system permease protein